jgi:hypothetical protein
MHVTAPHSKFENKSEIRSPDMTPPSIDRFREQQESIPQQSSIQLRDCDCALRAANRELLARAVCSNSDNVTRIRRDMHVARSDSPSRSRRLTS